MKDNAALPNCSGFSFVECISCTETYFLNKNFYLEEIAAGLKQNVIKESLINLMLLDEQNHFATSQPGVCQLKSSPFCASINENNVCEKCYDGYFLEDNYCRMNPPPTIPNCATYGSTNQCTDCVQGFFLNALGICQQNSDIPFCVEYSTNSL